MKKIIKVLLINIFLFLSILLIFEICFFIADTEWIMFNKNISLKDKISQVPGLIKIFYFPKRCKYDYYNENEFRPPFISENTNKQGAILLLGCSFTYGLGLADEDTFSGVLSKHTNRNVYNYGVNGGSMKDALYILRTPKILDMFSYNKSDVSYVIYTYIGDHYYRNLFDDRPFVPEFKNFHNIRLEYAGFNPFLQHFRTRNNIKKFLMLHHPPQYYAYSLMIQNLYLKEMNRTIKEIFPNAKFVVFIYDYLENSQLNIEQLRNEGIVVVKSDELLNVNLNDKQYKLSEEDTFHPNVKAWELIVPELVKKLDL